MAFHDNPVWMEAAPMAGAVTVQVDIATLFLMIVFLCFSLAFSVAWVNWKESDDGLKTWSIALCFQGCAYIILLMEGSLGDHILLFSSNFLISISYSIFLFSLLKFMGRYAHPSAMILPPIFVFFAFYFNSEHDVKALIVSNIVYLLQSVMVFFFLSTTNCNFPSRGKNLIYASMGGVALVALTRLALFQIQPDGVSGLFDTSAVQLMTFIPVFIAIVLVSNGFVMMAKERSDDRLRAMAMRDRLTGCWNRIRIEEAVQQEMERLRRYGYPVSLLIIDIDHFKQVNDRHGHATGDEILKEFSRIVGQTIRSTDLLGRWGGEEFVIILPASSFLEAVRLADRIRLNLERHLFTAGLRVTVSIGVSMCRSTDDWDDWLARADRALYQAKAAGRNQVWAENILVAPDQRGGEEGEPARLPWRKSYESGDSDIDRQHRELFDQANRLIALAAANQPREEILKCVAVLQEKTTAHFCHEEEFLRKNQFIEAEQHKLSHQKVISRADDIVLMFKANKIGTKELTHFFVYELIVQHMLIEDTRFFSILAVKD